MSGNRDLVSWLADVAILTHNLRNPRVMRRPSACAPFDIVGQAIREQDDLSRRHEGPAQPTDGKSSERGSYGPPFLWRDYP